MTLKDTAVLMDNSDFKERFRAEYYQLKIRRDGLDKMLDGYRKGTLSFTPKCPYGLLTEQLAHMDDYLSILERRATLENVDL